MSTASALPDPKELARRRATRALNRLAKWRTLLTGWQIGTRPKGDPVCDAIRDHREATLVLRAEVSALTVALIDRGVITETQWFTALASESDRLNQTLEQRFPGVTATHEGLTFDRRALAWMKGWPE